MADNKAHIIITVNSIILSAILSFLIRKIDSELYLAWPTALIMLVSLSAIIFAILSTRPSITKGTFSQQEVDEKKANLLFFGNFHKMSFESYSAAMLVAMNDKEYLYQMLIKDLYSQGAVLGKKYRLLRISYNIFMYGLVAAVFAFLIASLLFA
ncbi:Pycsar system effector family protein [Desertivirga brevis]|nr:Pycsar system effector family protein [Pedobacter sp. SYSU D00873]